MRVIFVNRFFHPDHSATSQILSDLAFALAKLGFKVTVLTSRQRYDDATVRLPREEVIRGVRVRRLGATQFGRGRPLGRLFDYASFHLAAALALLRLARAADVIVAKTDPPLLSITAALIAQVKNARLVNWLQDVFPEVLGAVTAQRPLVQRLVALLQGWRNRSLRSAACNVVVGRLMGQRLIAQGIDPQRIAIIENWCDGKLVHPVAPAHNALRTEWGMQQALVVGYSGNLGVAHEFDTILDAAVRLREHRDVIFLFIGGGGQLPAFQMRIRELGLNNVIFKPYQSRERLAESLSVPDVHLVCLRPDMEGLVVPSKFYGVLAAGRTCLFIGDPRGEIATALREAQCGETVRPGEGAALAQIVAAWAADRESVRMLGATARSVFEQRYDSSFAIGRWAAVLHALRSTQTSAGAAPALPAFKE